MSMRTCTPLLIMDQAGWHMSNNLVVPENITVLPLPPKSPELNPVKNLWHCIRENWLSNRVFRSYDDIVGHCCEPGESLKASLGASCPSDAENGPMGFYQ
ncbi:hypothetical protein EHI46_24205 [Rhizobium leguminosarum]|nr:hypothetical protein EHI46_24205 [Rhizobium leguminosarum]